MQHFRNRLNDKMLGGGGGTKKTVPPNFYWFMSSKNIFEFCVGKEIKFQARYIPNIKIGIYFFLADIFK